MSHGGPGTIQPTGPFEHALARLLTAAYKRRLGVVNWRRYSETSRFTARKQRKVAKTPGRKDLDEQAVLAMLNSSLRPLRPRAFALKSAFCQGPERARASGLAKNEQGVNAHFRARLPLALAEGVGFEPTVALRLQRFSRPSRSSTPAPFPIQLTDPPAAGQRTAPAAPGPPRPAPRG